MVLFPGASMPLYIFEPRYKEMVSDCRAGDGRFGIVYHDPDHAGPFLSEEGTVGCVAAIREHQPLEDGRSLIVVEGGTRFTISDGLESDTPYYEGLVTPYEDEPRTGTDIVALRQESIGLFGSLVDALEERPEARPELVLDEDVSFALAGSLRMDAAWLQGLLSLRDEADRLARLNRLFRSALD